MKKFSQLRNWFKEKLNFFLGEKDVYLKFNYLNLKDKAKNIYTSRDGDRFLVKFNEEKISIKPVDLISSALGIFPCYYFKGRLINKDESVSLIGKISMHHIPKYGLILWMSMALFLLILGASSTAYHSFIYVLSDDDVILSYVFMSALFFGYGFGLTLFGFLVIGIFKFIKRKEFKRIECFLKNLDKISL